MRNELSRTSAICAMIVAGLAATATAQPPQPPAPPANPNANIVVENPTYTTVGPLEITVNKPVAEVWKRIGAYCANRRVGADSGRLQDAVRQGR